MPGAWAGVESRMRGRVIQKWNSSGGIALRRSHKLRSARGGLAANSAPLAGTIGGIPRISACSLPARTVLTSAAIATRVRRAERAEGARTMVDSRKGEGMADRIDDLAGRVEAVEQKVDRLSASVDQRFDQVDAALVEQRLYTEFAYERLDAKMDAGFANMDGRFSRLERKLDQFIDTQSKTNELVERRLQALEPPSAS